MPRGRKVGSRDKSKLRRKTNLESWVEVGGSAGGGEGAVEGAGAGEGVVVGPVLGSGLVGGVAGGGFVEGVGKGEPFRFDGSLVRSVEGLAAGLGGVGELSAVEMEVYRGVPGSVLRVAEVLYVVGRAADFRQMRLLVRAKTRVDVPEYVLRFHLSRHVMRLNKERSSYLERLREVEEARSLEDVLSPEKSHYQAIADNVVTVLSGVTEGILDGRIGATLGDLKRLVDTVRVTQEVDPAMEERRAVMAARLVGRGKDGSSLKGDLGGGGVGGGQAATPEIGDRVRARLREIKRYLLEARSEVDGEMVEMEREAVVGDPRGVSEYERLTERIMENIEGDPGADDGVVGAERGVSEDSEKEEEA